MGFFQVFSPRIWLSMALAWAKAFQSSKRTDVPPPIAPTFPGEKTFQTSRNFTVSGYCGFFLKSGELNSPVELGITFIPILYRVSYLSGGFLGPDSWTLRTSRVGTSERPSIVRSSWRLDCAEGLQSLCETDPLEGAFRDDGWRSWCLKSMNNKNSVLGFPRELRINGL